METRSKSPASSDLESQRKEFQDLQNLMVQVNHIQENNNRQQHNQKEHNQGPRNAIQVNQEMHQDVPRQTEHTRDRNQEGHVHTANQRRPNDHTVNNEFELQDHNDYNYIHNGRHPRPYHIHKCLTRIDFPKFDGQNLDGWIYSAEEFFAIDNTPPNVQTRIARLHLVGKARIWYVDYITRLDPHVIVTWEMLKQEAKKKFGINGGIDDGVTTAFTATSHVPSIEEEDDYYELTTEDLHQLSASKKEDKNLKTKKIQDAEEEARRSKLPKYVIRVRFPDNTTLESTFQSSEKIQSLLDLVKKVIAQPDLPFYLHTTPPTKQIKDMSQDFYAAELFLVAFGSLLSTYPFDPGGLSFKGPIPLLPTSVLILGLLPMISSRLTTPQIPSEIGFLERLQYLNLEENLLTGPTPVEVGRCRKLVHLDLSLNSLSGVIPIAISDVSSLNSLNLSGNRIEVPDFLLVMGGDLAFSGNKGLCVDKTSRDRPSGLGPRTRRLTYRRSVEIKKACEEDDSE